MILLDIAKSYIIFFVVWTVFLTFFKKIRLSKRQFIFFWAFFVFSLSVFAYNQSLNYTNSDMFFHSNQMDQIRGSGISFIDFLFNNKNKIGGYSYTNLLTFNIIRYLIIKITSNNLLLPTICTVIDYSIIGYIIADWSYQDTGEYRLDIFTLLLNFAFIPYVYVITGLRNALAACLIGLGAYLYLYKKKRMIVLIILAFMAVTVHPVAILTIPFIFLAKLNIKFLGFVSVFLISVLAEPIAIYFSQSEISFLALIGRRYIGYTSDEQFRGGNAALYAVLIISAVFLLIYFLFYRRINKFDVQSPKMIMYNFFAIYMLYILANIGNYDMVIRPAYVLGVLSPILTSFLSDRLIWSSNGSNTWPEKLINLGITAGSIFSCLIVNYSFYLYLMKYYFTA